MQTAILVDNLPVHETLYCIRKRDILHVNWLAGLLPSTASGESELPKLLASNSLSAFLAR